MNYEECFPAQYGSFWLILVAKVVAQVNPLDLGGGKIEGQPVNVKTLTLSHIKATSSSA